MGGGGGAPAPDLYKEYYGELLAKAQMAPQVYATEAGLDPAYTALNLNTLNNTLFGVNNVPVSSPFGTAPSPGTSPQIPSMPAIPSMAPGMSGYTGTNGDGTMYRTGRGGYGTRTNRGYVNGPAPPNTPPPSAPVAPPTQYVNAPGLLDIYNRAAPELAKAQAASTTATRTANAADLMNLGPEAIAALNAADPETAKLLSSQTTDAQRGLDLGANLDPSLMRLATQGVRSQNQGMLGGTGNAGDFATALGLSAFGQQLRDNRRAYASNVFQQRGTYYGSAINSIMNGGQFVNALGATGNALNIGQGGPRLFGSDINAQQTFSDANNAAATNAATSANNSAALTSTGISAGVGIAGAAIIAF